MKHRLEILRKVPLFSGVKEETLLRLSEAAKDVKFGEGDTVLREGEAGTEMYILTKGTVRITKFITLHKTSAELADMEKDLITLSAENNPFFGEMSLLEKDERTATVSAVTDVELLSISSDAFDAMVKQDYEGGYQIVLRIAKTISSRLRKTNKDVVKLTTVLGIALSRERRA
jgi:CRP/FNR family transcriptional regulator, cyclic AMP receptor protein